MSIRVWSPDERAARPRLAICVTLRPETPLALLRAIRDGHIKAEPAVMIGNRPACRSLAEQFGVPWEMIGDAEGRADDERMMTILDQHQVDYVVLARYMRVLPPASCWKYAGGRIINLHHGLLPSFPGPRPYHDAYAGRMLTYAPFPTVAAPFNLALGGELSGTRYWTFPADYPERLPALERALQVRVEAARAAQP